MRRLRHVVLALALYALATGIVGGLTGCGHVRATCTTDTDCAARFGGSY